MKVVIDTNVVASGVFWSGKPLKILEAWFDGSLDVLITEDIFVEYSRILCLLGKKYSTPVDEILKYIEVGSSWVKPIYLKEQVCEDKDDDMFIECAISGPSKCIVSGDKLLLACSGYNNIKIMKPNEFYDNFLKEK